MKTKMLFLAVLMSFGACTATFAGDFDGVVFRVNDGEVDGPFVSTTSFAIDSDAGKLWVTKTIVVRGAARPYTFFGEATIPKAIQEGKRYELKVKGVSFDATGIGKEEASMKMLYSNRRIYLTDTNGKEALAESYKDEDYLDGSSVSEQVQRAYRYYVEEYERLTGK